MLNRRRLTQKVTISSGTVTEEDPYGNEVTVPAPAGPPVPGYLEQVDSVELVNGQETVVTKHQLWLLPETTIAARDVVEVDGDTWQVDGDPEQAWNPRARRVEFVLAHLVASTLDRPA